MSMACTSMRCLRSGDTNAANWADTAGVFTIAVIAGAAREEGEPGEGDVCAACKNCTYDAPMWEDVSKCAEDPMRSTWFAVKLREPGDLDGVMLGSMQDEGTRALAIHLVLSFISKCK